MREFEKLKIRAKEASEKLAAAREMITAKTATARETLTSKEHEQAEMLQAMETSMIARREAMERMTLLHSQLSEARLNLATAETRFQETTDSLAKVKREVNEAHAELADRELTDFPLVRKWEKETAKLQRRVATKEAYQPKLKALFPGRSEPVRPIEDNES